MRMPGARSPPRRTSAPGRRTPAILRLERVDVLLHAVALLPDAHALIVGGHDKESDLGAPARARVRARDRRARHVHRTGEPARGRGALASAAVLVLPNIASAISTRFTSPLKLFEYMAAGRAIVASDLPAIREILRDNENAVLVPPGDPRHWQTGFDACSTIVRWRPGSPPLRSPKRRNTRGPAARSGWKHCSSKSRTENDFAGASRIVRCPDCEGRSLGRGAGCRGAGAGCSRAQCGRLYESPADYLDLRPREQYAEQTKYLDEALHVDARHERVSPPLLGSKIRNDMLREFLAPRPGELVVDLGCGSGRALLWNRDLGATTVGIDIAPFFSRDARSGIDLMLAICASCRSPTTRSTKAWSLDVLEHLSLDALHGMLAEANRVLKPGGSLFVYTHVRKNAPVAAGLKWINKLARRLEMGPDRPASGTPAQVRSPQSAA